MRKQSCDIQMIPTEGSLRESRQLDRNLSISTVVIEAIGREEWSLEGEGDVDR